MWRLATELWGPENFGLGSCVTSVAGPHGCVQLYERWRWALRVRRSGR